VAVIVIGSGRRREAISSTLGLLHMLCQVEGRTFSMASDFNPAVASLDLSIPAIVRIMGHFVRAMLSEANGLSTDTNTAQEHVAASEEVADGLISYYAVSNSFTDVHHNRAALASILSRGGPHGEISSSDFDELVMALV